MQPARRTRSGWCGRAWCPSLLREGKRASHFGWGRVNSQDSSSYGPFSACAVELFGVCPSGSTRQARWRLPHDQDPKVLVEKRAKSFDDVQFDRLKKDGLSMRRIASRPQRIRTPNEGAVA